MNVETVVNNGALRSLVRRGGIRGARAVLRQALRPLILPPKKVRMLRSRVRAYLEAFFPEMGPEEVARRTEAFLAHYLTKFAEDTVTLNVRDIQGFIRGFDELLVCRGTHHLIDALQRPGGLLVVGSHVGAVTLGTVGFLYLFLGIPHDLWPEVKLCSEPEVARFPRVLSMLEQALREFDGEVSFILTDRDRSVIGEEMRQTLRAGHLVTTNIDVLMGGRSARPFPLFDGRAKVRLPALVGATKMALATGATVLPWSNVRTAAGYRLEIHPPIGPVERVGDRVDEDHPVFLALAERLRQRLEGWVRSAPEQWTYWDRLHHRLVSAYEDPGGEA